MPQSTHFASRLVGLVVSLAVADFTRDVSRAVLNDELASAQISDKETDRSAHGTYEWR